MREASRLTRFVRAELVADDQVAKADGTPVTIADFGAQALIVAKLREALGADVRVIAEEDARGLRNAPQAELCARVVRAVHIVRPELSRADILDAIDVTYAAASTQKTIEGSPQGEGTDQSEEPFWVLDPIDGTKGFIRPGAQYAICLARIENGTVQLGVLGCPSLPFDHTPVDTLDDPQRGDPTVGTLFEAVAGGGARQWALHEDGSLGESEVLRVTDVGSISEATATESASARHGAHRRTARILGSLGIPTSKRLDSQAKYGALARGDVGIYLRLPLREKRGENLWDHAAGLRIVEEAGGQVTDLAGGRLDVSQPPRFPQNRGILATNGPLHTPMLEAIRADYDAHPPPNGADAD